MIEKFAIDYQRVLLTMSLLKNVEDSDYTERHSLRVGRLVKQMCNELGYDLKKTNNITRSAYFHDVGKIKLDKKVLFKLGVLDDEDFEEMKLHPEYSYDILMSLGLPNEAEIVKQHHERIDGSGYPLGLVGDDIKYEAKIISVADVFDAITSNRPYRKKRSVESTLIFMYSKAGKEFDLELIQLLHKTLENEKKLKNTIDI